MNVTTGGGALLGAQVGRQGARDALERARAEFLATGEVPAGVRETTARSWLRSLRAGVSPTSPRPRFVREPAGDCALMRAARPVIDELFAQLGGSGAASMLVDAEAVILDRWSSDRHVVDGLDTIGAIPGYSFEESCVGTTALGTVIEEGEPVVVLGSEHFAEIFHAFSAVGAPIRHPITGRLEGVIDLVLSNSESSSLMLPLIVRAAEEISARLLSGYSAADRTLLDGFLRADRRGPRVPTLAINSRMQMCNCEATDLLGDADRVLLWKQVQRARDKGEVHATLVVGQRQQVAAKLVDVHDGTTSVGVVVQLRPTREDRTVEPGGREVAEEGREPVDALRDLLPGRSVAWGAVLRRACSAAVTRRALLLVGESGVGKTALGQALAPIAAPGRTAVVIDGRQDATVGGLRWEGVVDPHDAEQPVLVTHAEKLDGPQVASLCRLLDEIEETGRFIAVTYTRDVDLPDVPSILEERFSYVLDLPPLRERAEDVADIAERMVWERDGALRLETRTIHRLMEREWPGNARQLRRVIDSAVAAAPGSVVRPDDLPDAFRGRIVRGQVTRLKRAERDAIQEVLRQTEGNKRLAAAALGISRSTLYRKLETHGLGG